MWRRAVCQKFNDFPPKSQYITTLPHGVTTKKEGWFPTRLCDNTKFRSASRNFENNFQADAGFMSSVRLSFTKQETILYL
jgi:hypothetical protein